MHVNLVLTPEGRSSLDAGLAPASVPAPPAGAFAPGDIALILIEDAVRGPVLLPARFGRRQGKAGRLVAAVRADALHRDASLRDAFVRRRCAVPADGLYLFATRGRGPRPPLLRRPDGGTFLLLALWEEQVDERTGEHHAAFTLLSTATGAGRADGGPVLPALVPPSSEAAKRWLRPSAPGDFAAEALLGLLAAAPGDFLVAPPGAPTVDTVRPATPPRIRLARRPPAASAAPPPRRRPEQLSLF